jgi:hypothetical protein
MRYLLLVCVDPAQFPPEGPGPIEPWIELVGGRRLLGHPLQPARTAATVRVRGTERRVHDGPFAQTQEVIAGFDVLECASQEEAVELAAAHPVAAFGSVEVRALLED